MDPRRGSKRGFIRRKNRSSGMSRLGVALTQSNPETNSSYSSTKAIIRRAIPIPVGIDAARATLGNQSLKNTRYCFKNLKQIRCIAEVVYFNATKFQSLKIITLNPN